MTTTTAPLACGCRPYSPDRCEEAIRLGNRANRLLNAWGTEVRSADFMSPSSRIRVEAAKIEALRACAAHERHFDGLPEESHLDQLRREKRQLDVADCLAESGAKGRQ